LRTAVSTSRGILQAATSDNAQPLTILACEKFGNTIAMCQETCRKIETTILPNPPTAVVRFLKGTVGYSTDDCVSQLVSSSGGVQFLSLAAPLVTTLSPFNGAKSLLLMMKSSEAHTTQLPTTTQLEGLLSVLEARLHRSGYTDTVLGWHLILCSIPELNTELRNELREDSVTPSQEAIQKLVDTFRQLDRIGTATAVKATVTVTSCAPWVIAFTRWCLGIPPSVYLDDGTPVIEQPNSKATVIIRTPANEKDGILVVSIGNPENLLAGDSGEF